MGARTESEIAEMELPEESKTSKPAISSPLSPRKAGWGLSKAVEDKLRAKLKSKIIPQNSKSEDTISAADAVIAFTTNDTFMRKNRAAKSRNATTLEQFMERLHLSHYIQPMKDKLGVTSVAQLSSVKLEQLRRIGMNGIVCSRVLLAIAGIRNQYQQDGNDMQAMVQFSSLHGTAPNELLSPRSKARTLQLSDDEEESKTQAKAKEIAALQESSSATLTRSERRRLRRLKKKESRGEKVDEEDEARRQRRRERRKSRRRAAKAGKGWLDGDHKKETAAAKPTDGNKVKEAPTDTPTEAQDEDGKDSWFYGSKSKPAQDSSTRVGPSGLSREERRQRRKDRKEKQAVAADGKPPSTPTSPARVGPGALSRAERRRQRKEKREQRAVRDAEPAASPVPPTVDLTDESPSRSERRRQRKEKRAAESAASPASPTVDLDESPSRSERRRQRKEKRALRDVASAADTASPTVDLVESSSRSERRRQRKEKRASRRSIKDSADPTTIPSEESPSRSERSAERPQRRKSRRRRNDEGAIQTPMVKEESGLVSIRAENIEHVRAGPGGREQRRAKKKRSRRSRAAKNDTPAIGEADGDSVLKI